MSDLADDSLRAVDRTAIVDALLREQLGGETAGVDAARLVERFHRGEGARAAARAIAAAATVADPVRRQRWLAAALALLGVAVVVGVALLQRDAAPQPAGAGAQDDGTSAPRRVLVSDLAQLRALLPRVEALRAETSWLDDPAVAQRIDIAGVVVTATAAQRDDLLAALRNDVRMEAPAGWEWENLLTLQLDDRRTTVELAVDRRRGDRLVLGLRGLQGDLSIGEPAATAVEQLLLTTRLIARQGHGIVTSTANLVGDRALPESTEILRLFAVGDADLAHLQRFQALRSLDLRGLAVRLGKVGLRHIGDRVTLQELRLSGQFEDVDLLHLLPLVDLRRLDLRGVTGFTGEGFAHYTNSSRLRSGPRSFDLTDVDLTAAGVDALAQWGACSLTVHRGRLLQHAAAWRRLLDSGRLLELDLSHTPLDEVQIAAVADCRTLTALTLDHCELRDAQLQILAATKAPLRRLSLRGNPIHAGGVAALCALPTLAEIDLRDVVPIDLAAARAAAGDRITFRQ